jgi:RIO-like serine/threonine protein kinase
MIPILKYNSNLIPLSTKKPIYYIENKPDFFVKTFKIQDIKKMDNEFRIHSSASAIVNCPKLIDCYEEDYVGYFVMQRIDGKSLAELYGTEPKNIPKNIWKEIHQIISKLYYKDIHYVDITPYNFMIEKNTDKLYIIDFGDAYIMKVNWFLKDFLDGENSWNSDFA